MSPCNSIGMSPSRVPCRKAGRPDGDDRDEQQGTAKDVIDDTCDGGIATTARGGRDAEGVIPAGEAHLASLPARRRQRLDTSWTRTAFPCSTVRFATATNLPK